MHFYYAYAWDRPSSWLEVDLTCNVRSCTHVCFTGSNPGRRYYISTTHAEAHLAGGLLSGHRIAVPHVAPAHPGALAARHGRVFHDKRPLNLAPEAAGVTRRGA